MKALTYFVVAATLTIPALAATTSTWPTKPVRFVTAFAAGGSSDTIARIVSEQLTGVLAQQVVVDNRSGGNGVLGSAIAAQAPADGYTWLVVFDSHATNSSLNKSLPYDTLRDFAPVMLLASSPYALIVAANSSYKSVADIINAAKAKPGELTLGSSGIGSRGHLAMALLEQRAGFKITQVAYRGPAQVLTDVLGGQITMQMGTFFFAAPFIKSQRVRALGVTSPSRMPQLQDVPTIAEQGFPGYEVRSWWGVVAPAAMPKPIMQQMHAALSKVLARPEVKAKLEQLGATVHASTAEEFGRVIRSEMQLWGKVVRDAKIASQ
jgi:tripartite-type tricarboxylate transporter receptor subunit TctC